MVKVREMSHMCRKASFPLLNYHRHGALFIFVYPTEEGDLPDGERILRAGTRAREQYLATQAVILALEVLRQLALFTKVRSSRRRFMH